MVDDIDGRRREGHNATIGIVATAILMFCGGFFVGGFLAPPQPNRNWFYEYQSFIGSVVGAVVAVVAAAMAWISVQRQISIQKTLAEAEQNEARLFIISSFDEHLRAINEIWRVLESDDPSMDLSKKESFLIIQRSKVIAIGINIKNLSSELTSIYDYAKNLLKIKDRRNIDILIGFARQTNSYIADFSKPASIDPTDWPGGICEKISYEKRIVVTVLSHLREACIRFDPSLGEIFGDRRGVPVDWTQKWNHLRKFADSFPDPQ